MISEGLTSKIYEQLIQLNIKNQTTQLKMDRRSELTFFHRRHIDGQQAHEKMFNIVNHQRSENKNHNEISPYTCQNGYHQKDHR